MGKWWNDQMVIKWSNGEIAADLQWPQTAQTTPISTFCTAFHIFVIFRNFKFGL